MVRLDAMKRFFVVSKECLFYLCAADHVEHQPAAGEGGQDLSSASESSE